MSWISSFEIYMQISKETLVRLNGQDLAEKEAAEEAARKNSNFVQVQKSALKDMRSLAQRSPKAMTLLLTLVEKMNRENALMISKGTLVQITGMSMATLTRCITLLKEERWIQIIKVGTSNVYRVNSLAFWQSSKDKMYTSFRATIVACQDEQEENWDGLKLKHFPLLESADVDKMIITDEQLPPPDQGELNV